MRRGRVAQKIPGPGTIRIRIYLKQYERAELRSRGRADRLPGRGKKNRRVTRREHVIIVSERGGPSRQLSIDPMLGV